MNASKIIARNSGISECMMMAIRDMNVFAAALVDFHEAERRDYHGIEYMDRVKATAAKAVRAITVLTDALDIRGEVQNVANKSMEKSAAKILSHKQEVEE